MVILLCFDCNLIFNQEAIHLQACLLSAVQQHEIQNLSGFTVIKIDQTKWQHDHYLRLSKFLTTFNNANENPGRVKDLMDKTYLDMKQN